MVSSLLASNTAKNHCLVILDLDDFKLVNDQYGHNAGDAVLKAFADALRVHTREDDIIARWGGEEFVVLLPETNIEEAKSLAERFRRLAQSMVVQEHADVNSLTASFGVTEMRSGETLDSMISAADAALFIV